MIPFKSLESVNLENKTVLITGASSGLGFEEAKFFAGRGAHVIMASRNLKKGNEALEEIKAIYPKSSLRMVKLDLSDSSSILDFSTEIHASTAGIDFLINNAGIMAVPFELTKDGYESQIGVNYLGHFRLTAYLFDLLNQNARIVNLSSVAHKSGKLDFDNFMYEKGGYSPFASYSRSKLADLMFTFALMDHMPISTKNITVVSAHPGVASTGLFTGRNQSALFKIFAGTFARFSLPASDGAKPVIMACLDPEAISGNFYGPQRTKNGVQVKLDQPIPLALNKQAQESLWKYSVAKTAAIFPS